MDERRGIRSAVSLIHRPQSVNDAAEFPVTEAWRLAPLESSGLPRRILAALRLGGLSRLGDLCTPLPSCPTLSEEDRALLERVAAWCRGVCQGHPPPLTLCDWLTLFLPPRLEETLRVHFGLEDSAAALSLHEGPLSRTAAQLGISRERIRQRLVQACQILRHTLPRFAAEPLFQSAEKILQAAGGVLDAAFLARHNDPVWGGTSPVGAFLLLVRVLPDRLVIYRGFFSLFSDRLLDRAEKALCDRLILAQGLLPVREIALGLPADARAPKPFSSEPLLRMLLRHLPGTLATLDGRAGLSERDSHELIREILAERGQTPLRELMTVFNERIYPECRRGSGFLRAVVRRDPLIRRLGSDRYAFSGNLQIGLPL